MPVPRPKLQPAAARVLLVAATSGTRTARRVTTVTSISRAGIVRQHAQRRLSRANLYRERSMQFEKQLSRDRSSFALARSRADGYRDRASGYPAYPTGDVITLRPSSEADTSWRAVSAAASALMTRAAAGLALCSEVAFPNVLLAVLSWTFAQALAGCAAYAEAMYPGLADAQSEHGNGGLVRSDMRSVAAGESGRAGSISLPRQTAPSAPAVQTESAARPEPTRSAVSIASLIGQFRSRMRGRRERRLAIAELQALDDRSLRDIGISRSDIAYIVRRGDRCE
jgi:uncharacterized protein YjiS (DUF1127 family)